VSILTVPEMAGLLRVSTATIYRSIHKWPHLRVGTEIRFTPEHVEQILTLLTKQPTPPETKRTPRIGTKARKNP
jgi:excisionase family DNA binding protein